MSLFGTLSSLSAPTRAVSAAPSAPAPGGNGVQSGNAKIEAVLADSATLDDASGCPYTPPNPQPPPPW